MPDGRTSSGPSSPHRGGASGTADSGTTSADSSAAIPEWSGRSCSGFTAATTCSLITPAMSHRPFESVNYVTCHDGFTLYDAVAYNEKRNWRNGHGNNDGARR